ncbi:EAL domain-containing protein [Bradyrhizobium sp. U87765 SZCCT0131]|uniref:EAL domain-containing protein n=1 Tax=unclassified Bradyrhizobium TaxID=2631580 RepID=UPI001BAA1CE6|nr:MULTISPECIES: EAL domain-containing protein [unclassified Bradyrhizobium]MBR1216436.1 EAL domain-containing protein [Bradyrhizobium sp. U87765 SZCCT0131]MBR1259815.1 EAL domain-containing protein [Bradyrhizobium sp. U87765 SZCCT0134]MBR1305949.1 EAL domain-containing protein [Bradyrhizobium sp. U87765 SZCCT0110]MBR1322316.1 EAL domain-containing protein [Bradyrhizobium sp. U87765 SZCCT0109]MBR1352394.1 EAL domain-containing protein [Bradyrhizobium sp. U87765 SZCCT0048]
MASRLNEDQVHLLRLVLPFIAIVLLQAFIAGVSFNILSSVRGYVGGEGLWSKGQKDAIYYLTLYAETGSEQYYRNYQQAVAIPLGDRIARRALEQSPPDIAAARNGFLQGGNHQDDVEGLIWLYRYFRSLPAFKTAIGNWTATDPLLDELTGLAAIIRADVTSDASGRPRLAGWPLLIHRANERMSREALKFSESLGEGSRQVKTILTVINLITAALLVALQFFYTRHFIAQRHRFESDLRAEKERAQITLASIGDAVITTDASGHIDYLNATAERLLACRAAEAKGVPLTSLVQAVDETAGEDATGRIERIWEQGEATASPRPLLLLRSDEAPVPVSVVGAPLRKDGVAAGAVLILHDMTSERDYIARLSWQASHDALTGLANRREFERRLDAAMARSGTADDAEVHALMFLDLDQFKIINDTCGHAAGDKLLCQIAASLPLHLQPGDLLARLGGDEFAVLLQNCEIDRASDVAETLRQAVQGLSFNWNGSPFNITASIGLVAAGRGRATTDEVVRTADLACYMAKEKGRNRVQLHDPGDSELLHRFGEMAWVQRIHDALEEQRLCLYAQTIAPLGDESEAGGHVELLLRLRDKDGRVVAPGDFIPAAERYGLMPMLDRWVVSRAFKTLAERGGGLATCAINLSGATFNDEKFIDFIRAQFELYGIAPRMICFEITETSAIASLDSANRFIGLMKQLGCRFALDDFGSGMSSFAYLKHLPVDYLKIDGSFVRDMLDDPIDRAIIEMINRIGKVMGKRTIAEFVENDATLQALRAIGVDYAQGYGIGRPEPFERLAEPRHIAPRGQRQVA